MTEVKVDNVEDHVKLMMGKDRLMILGENPLFSTMALGVPRTQGG